MKQHLENQTLNESRFLYHGFIIEFCPKEIPNPKGYDWDAYPHFLTKQDCGEFLISSASVADAKNDIDALLVEFN